jgi:amino acid transporter
MNLTNLIFGRPLSNTEARGERLGAKAGIPVFGLDALSSAAYGPEAALFLLIGLGAAGIRYLLPITVSISILLVIVYFSYRQTIQAYPHGGGSYTVAGQNLGPFAGLLAATALMIDYVLTAAVGISAGVGALVSAVPQLEPRTVGLCLAILLIICLVNLRGVREAGIAFMLPTYLFVGTLGITLLVGLAKTIAAAGHPVAVVPPPPMTPAVATFSIFLLLKSFASGCTAMTGVEAVSNGVQAFRQPVTKTAQLTLTIIILLLLGLLLGIAVLCPAYHIGAMPSGPGYQSVLSQLASAVVGRGWFYYLTIASILLVVSLSANTAFADFPRLCRLLAEDCYLPTPFAVRGRRLVFTVGIVVLTLLCGALLLAFGGVTDRLIPLYAVGAFMAFTLSQAGMVAHWKRVDGRGAHTAMWINGVGAAATAITVGIVVVTKFTQGAWITVLVIPCVMVFMYRIRKHYDSVRRQIDSPKPLDLRKITRPLVVIPIFAVNRIARDAIEFALDVTSDIQVIHVEDESAPDRDTIRASWKKIVEEPLELAEIKAPSLHFLPSPYRFVVDPIVNYVLEVERRHPGRQVAVIVPYFIEKQWYHYFLHNQRAAWLKTALLLRGGQRIAVISFPWHLR